MKDNESSKRRIRASKLEFTTVDEVYVSVSACRHHG
jgi:hypothetical protein